MRQLLLCLAVLFWISPAVVAVTPVPVSIEDSTREPPKGVTAGPGESYFNREGWGYVRSVWFDEAGNRYTVTTRWPLSWESNGWLWRVQDAIENHRKLVRKRKAGKAVRDS